MRVIGADDALIGGSQAPIQCDVLGRINPEARGARLEIPGPDAVVDGLGGADEQAATLVGRLVTRVRDEGFPDGVADLQLVPGLYTWTTIAVPMPPPTHKDAAPRPPPFACRT